MKIEIWSDVICPFCYIGKRNLETAIEQFSEKKYIEIVWKSFLIDPSISEVAKDSYRDHLVNRKGLRKEQVDEMLANITLSAKNVGLDFDFDNNILVNSRTAHKLIQFAKSKGLGNEIEESLFRSFFTEGKNTADIATLTKLGTAIGLDESELKSAFTDKRYDSLLEQDMEEGQKVGVRGVPFFVFDGKYTVSGAQPSIAFLELLEESFTEWRIQNPQAKQKNIQGQTCSTDGVCE